MAGKRKRVSVKGRGSKDGPKHGIYGSGILRALKDCEASVSVVDGSLDQLNMMISNIVDKIVKHTAKCLKKGTRISLKGVIKAIKAYRKVCGQGVYCRAFDKIAADGGALFKKVQASKEHGKTWLAALKDHASIMARLKLMKESIIKKVGKVPETKAIILLQCLAYEIICGIASLVKGKGRKRVTKKFMSKVFEKDKLSHKVDGRTGLGECEESPKKRRVSKKSKK